MLDDAGTMDRCQSALGGVWGGGRFVRIGSLWRYTIMTCTLYEGPFCNFARSFDEGCILHVDAVIMYMYEYICTIRIRSGRLWPRVVVCCSIQAISAFKHEPLSVRECSKASV